MASTVKFVGLALMAVLLAGCASDSYVSARATVVHDKFDHLNCQQLDAGIAATQKQIDNLVAVRNKAAQEAAGAALSGVVYGPTLATAHGNLRAYQETREQKRCASVTGSTAGVY